MNINNKIQLLTLILITIIITILFNTREKIKAGGRCM